MSGSNWSDLRVRMLSGLALFVVAAIAVWAQPVGLWVLLWVLFLTAHWELSHMFGANKDRQFWIMGLSALVGLIIIVCPSLVLPPFMFAFLVLCIPLILGFISIENNHGLYLAYGAFAVLGVTGLWHVFEVYGLEAILVLIGIVILSDVAGYFVGRQLGGPKFWPAISPKKTWSGTIAGWVAAGILGLIIAIATGYWAIVPAAVILAFGAQMGDIAESAVKRILGVKDSSDLIPGHGGVLDRFDGLFGAAVTALIIMVFV